MYMGSAPVFVACKLPDLEWLEYKAQIDVTTSRPYDADASMLLRRLKIHRFTKRVKKPDSAIEFCPRCFAQMVLNQTGASSM